MLGSAHPKALSAASQEAWPERLKFYGVADAIGAIFGKIPLRNDSYLAKETCEGNRRGRGGLGDRLGDRLGRRSWRRPDHPRPARRAGVSPPTRSDAAMDCSEVNSDLTSIHRAEISKSAPAHRQYRESLKRSDHKSRPRDRSVEAWRSARVQCGRGFRLFP
jgi:hypothetical protein